MEEFDNQWEINAQHQGIFASIKNLRGRNSQSGASQRFVSAPFM